MAAEKVNQEKAPFKLGRQDWNGQPIEFDFTRDTGKLYFLNFAELERREGKGARLSVRFYDAKGKIKSENKSPCHKERSLSFAPIMFPAISKAQATQISLFSMTLENCDPEEEAAALQAASKTKIEEPAEAIPAKFPGPVRSQDLSLSLRPQKFFFRGGEPLTLTVTLKNISGEAVGLHEPYGCGGKGAFWIEDFQRGGGWKALYSADEGSESPDFKRLAPEETLEFSCILKVFFWKASPDRETPPSSSDPWRDSLPGGRYRIRGEMIFRMPLKKRSTAENYWVGWIQSRPVVLEVEESESSAEGEIINRDGFVQILTGEKKSEKKKEKDAQALVADLAKTLEEAVRHMNKETFYESSFWAVRALKDIGTPEAQEALDGFAGQMIQKLESTHESQIQEKAALTLNEIGTPEALQAFRGYVQKMMPGLFQALSDKNIEVRWRAVDALGRMGSEAGEAVEALKERFADESVEVRIAALNALEKIGTEEALETIEQYKLLESKKKEQPKEPQKVEKPTMSKLNTESAPSPAPTFTLPLQDEGGGVGRGAESLSQAPTSVLIESLNHPLRDAREIIEDELAGRGESALPEIRQALKDPDPTVRASAVNVLAKMGKDAEPAIQDLIQMLEDEEWSVSFNARLALKSLGTPEAKTALKSKKQK